jgi:DNA-binding SARP family transcriptional activator
LGNSRVSALFGGCKVRTLLRVLAVRTPDLVPHEALAEALWPDRLPADPAANLGVLVNRARRALGDAALIVTGSGGYALGPCRVDVAEFRAALHRARAAGDDHPAALRACAAALGLWGEPLPEDTYADWAREPRERLSRDRVDACELASWAALALGDARGAASWAADAVAAEPLRESATVALARALAAAGDPAGALARLAELRARLAEQLGVDPSADVEQLQVALLRGAVRAVRRVGVPTGVGPRSFAGLAFVGRADELARLRAVVDARGMGTLTGVAGAGKSRLLAELARWSALPVLSTRAFLPDRAEAWGLARSMLREALAVDAAVVEELPPRVREALAGLLPELDAGPGGHLDGESRRALVLAGGLRMLEAATGSGALLVVDDLQWADPSSLALLGSVLARLPRLAAVLALRPGELPAGALADLRDARPGDDVRLGALPPAALDELLADPALVRAVRETTDRTPFAIDELLREVSARELLGPAPRARRKVVITHAGCGRAGEGARPGGPAACAPPPRRP